jgi:hypothetical protein
MFEEVDPRGFSRDDLPGSGQSPFSVQQHALSPNQSGAQGFNGSLPDESQAEKNGTTWRYKDLKTGGLFKFHLGQHLSLQMYWFDLADDVNDWEFYQVKRNAKNEETRFLIDSQSQRGGATTVKEEATSRSIFVFSRWDHFELITDGGTEEMSANMVVSRW